MIRQVYHIHAPVAAVWRALVDPKRIEAWSGGPVVMSARIGARFSLWGGQVYGKNIAVVPRKKLTQEWYGGDWPEPSIVTFTLRVERSGTRVDLTHARVPSNEIKDFAQGWKDYYLGPLKESIERATT